MSAPLRTYGERWHGYRGAPRPPRDIARFMAKVDRTTSCWLWTGARVRGYGSFWLDGSTVLAHRFSWFLAHGIWPGQVLDHRCNNKQCVNPAHLDDVSTAENNRRAISDGLRARTQCINGHALTDDNIGLLPRQNARYCRTCKRNASARLTARRRAARQQEASA